MVAKIFSLSLFFLSNCFASSSIKALRDTAAPLHSEANYFQWLSLQWLCTERPKPRLRCWECYSRASIPEPSSRPLPVTTAMANFAKKHASDWQLDRWLEDAQSQVTKGCNKNTKTWLNCDCLSHLICLSTLYNGIWWGVDEVSWKVALH